MDTGPIVVIAGPTASGKTEIAVKLAKRYCGEIVCADSRTVYRDMDIGTAKPTAAEQSEVVHHGLDLINPDERYSAAEFKSFALEKIAEIHRKGKIAFIVGGSGLYIDALIYDFQFAPRNAEKDPVNPRHKSKDQPKVHGKIDKNVLYIGLQVHREVLKKNIEKRVQQMMKAGLEQEVRKIISSFGKDAPAILAPGYKAIIEYIDGKKTITEALDQFVIADMQLAKRQMTWFRRNRDIVWVHNFEQANKLVSNFVP